MRPKRGPYGLTVVESCVCCPVREERLFCRLGREALRELEAIRQTSVYPRGAVLFVLEEMPRGIHLLCAGRAKLTLGSARGRNVILETAGPGDLLGLGEVLSGTPYGATAETLEPTEVSFLPRGPFTRFLSDHPEVALRAGQQLTSDIRHAHRRIALLALAPDVRAKLARLLLDRADPPDRAGKRRRAFTLRLTHEEIGELIGSSRETVTRLMNGFRRAGLIETREAIVEIKRPAELEALASASFDRRA